MSNLHPLVDRGSETQLEVGEFYFTYVALYRLTVKVEVQLYSLILRYSFTPE